MSAPTLSPDEELHWLALQLVPGLGARRSAVLIERFETPQAVFRASRTELESAGLSGALAQSISSGCTFEDAAAQQELMRKCGAAGVPISDARYPALLKEIYDPPIFLFARGNLELAASHMLGVVGTRRPSPYGTAVAEKLAAELAAAGLTIVSGMARGIDTAAHKGASSVDGNTVAVLGCGVDMVYPAENRKLAAQIAAQGLLLSEFPMGAPAFPQNFPVRNRIISGMSLGVLVVEGAEYSGSSITARLALEQGREVFAVPGNITSKVSWGPNLLIKQGAKLVQDWNDVIVELSPAIQRQLIERGRSRILGSGADRQAQQGESGGGAQASLFDGPSAGLSRKILTAIRVDSSIHLDVLMDRMDGVSSSELIAALFELEMLGMIKQLPGKNYVKVW